MTEGRFSMRFTALPVHIDVMGHVNNAVWLQWVQDLATAHWEETAAAEHVARYAWVVTRHEIDYRGNIAEGESVIGETWIPDGPKGARFDRMVAFRKEDRRNEEGGGQESPRPIVTARSTWAMIDGKTGRLMRVPPEVAAPFVSPPAA